MSPGLIKFSRAEAPPLHPFGNGRGGLVALWACCSITTLPWEARKVWVSEGQNTRRPEGMKVGRQEGQRVNISQSLSWCHATVRCLEVKYQWHLDRLIAGGSSKPGRETIMSVTLV